MTRSDDPDQIRREIERTQAHLSSDVDALTEKVTPSRIVARRVDRARAAGAVIQREGAVFKDRFGQPRLHPAVLVERDNTAAMLRALNSLGLDLEPLRDGPGRPPAGR